MTDMLRDAYQYAVSHQPEILFCVGALAGLMFFGALAIALCKIAAQADQHDESRIDGHRFVDWDAEDDLRDSWAA